MPNLNERVMCVSLSITTFTGEKVDRSISNEVASMHNADAYDAGRYSKQIIGKRALESIKQIASASRVRHYNRTLPFADNGARLLSIAGYLPYMEEMRQLRAAFGKEVDYFCQAYPRMIEEARTRLNGMFNVDDYPPIDTLRHRFSFDVNASPLPSGQNWFLDMAEDQMNFLRSHADQRLQFGIDQAVKDVYRRVADVTKAMSSKLTDYTPGEKTGAFRDSLVSNVRELADMLPALNITDDPELKSLHAELASLTTHTPATLRNDATTRETTAAKAQAIYDKASAFM